MLPAARLAALRRHHLRHTHHPLTPAPPRLNPSGSFFATALASGIFTFMMGLVVNVPVALAPGMGLNGYFNTLAKGVCWGPGVGPDSSDDDLMAAFPKDCPSW